MQPKSRWARSFTLDDATDLAWIWTEAEAELGVRSSMGGMLDRAAAGALFEFRAAGDLALPDPGACARFSRVSKNLETLSFGNDGFLHERILFAVHGPPPRLGSADDLAAKALRSERGLVLRHLPALRALAEKRHRGSLLLALEAEAKARRLEQWAAEARDALAAARAAYAAARVFRTLEAAA